MYESSFSEPQTKTNLAGGNQWKMLTVGKLFGLSCGAAALQLRAPAVLFVSQLCAVLSAFRIHISRVAFHSAYHFYATVNI